MSKFKNIKAIVTTHVTLDDKAKVEVYGQCHSLADFLKLRVERLIFIRHPLNGMDFSRANLFEKKQTRELKIIRIKGSGVIRYIVDVLSTVWLILEQKGKWDVFIGIDSLNAFSGILLRIFGKVKYVVFYTADFVPIRFHNLALNTIYHMFDFFAIKCADYVWNISQSQMEIRKKQRVPIGKNIYVPHGADLSQIKPLPMKKINRNSMVVAANLTVAFNYKLIVDAFRKILDRVPQAKLNIIGSGPLESEIRAYITFSDLEGTIKMLGWFSHGKLIDYMRRCGIGLAIYTDLCSWTKFSDSFKVKEYLGCACPVIIAGAEGAFREVEDSRAVITVGNDDNELSKAMTKLLTDDAYYLRCRENAIKFMQQLDWQDIYMQALKFLSLEKP